jgi:hypothetical protein
MIQVDKTFSTSLFADTLTGKRSRVEEAIPQNYYNVNIRLSKKNITKDSAFL